MDFDAYLKKIETAAPTIRAVGITDYYLLDTYERVRKAKAEDSRLAKVDLVFPNIELRLDFGLPKGGWINAHLLVCPDDPNHLKETKNLLAQLTFRADGTLYNCNEQGLIRLGQSVDSKLEGKAAIAMGATQFKVSFQQLQDIYRDLHWASKDRNILIAVAGSKTDGTSGLQEEAEGKIRQEVERFAHVIFASSPAQRDFWLGKKPRSRRHSPALWRSQTLHPRQRRSRDRKGWRARRRPRVLDQGRSHLRRIAPSRHRSWRQGLCRHHTADAGTAVARDNPYRVGERSVGEHAYH